MNVSRRCQRKSHGNVLPCILCYKLIAIFYQFTDLQQSELIHGKFTRHSLVYMLVLPLTTSNNFALVIVLEMRRKSSCFKEKTSRTENSSENVKIAWHKPPTTRLYSSNKKLGFQQKNLRVWEKYIQIIRSNGRENCGLHTWSRKEG